VKSFVVVLVVLVVLVLVAMSDDTAMNIPHDGDDEDEDEEFEFLLNSVRCGANLESVKARFMQSKAKKETWFDSSRSPSLLHAACSRGDAQVVQYILEEAKKYFSTTGVAQKEKNKKNNAKKKTTTTTTSSTSLEEYLVLRDFESGHSAMHRCLFHGPNLTCARTLLRFAKEHCSKKRSVNLLHQPTNFRGHTPIESLSITTAALEEKDYHDDDDDDDESRGKRRTRHLRRRRSDVFSWGSGVNYTLGTGNHKLNTDGRKRIEYFAKHHLNVTSLSCSRFRSFATTKEGEVYSWGLTDWNSYSKTNDEVPENNASPALKREADMFPTLIKTFIGGTCSKPKIVKITCSENFALLVDDSGSLYIMGKTFGLFSSTPSDAGSASDGSNINSGEDDSNCVQVFPRRIFGDDKRDPISRETFKEQRIVDASCGNAHAVVIDSKGRCWSFGINSTGQLGFQIDASPRVKFPRVVVGIEGDCLSVSCSDETTLVLVRKKSNNVNAIVRFGSGDCKPKQIRCSSRSMIISMSCGNIISAFVCENGDLYRFHSKKLDDNEAQRINEFNAVSFVSCTMSNSRGCVLSRNGDCYEFEVNERSGECSVLNRIVGIKRATLISISDKHALSISNWTEPKLIRVEDEAEEENLQCIACRVVCEDVLDLSNCLECLQNLPNLAIESGKLLEQYAYEFAALNLDALLEVYDVLGTSDDDEHESDAVLSRIGEQYTDGVELTLGLGWDVEKTYDLVLADEEEKKKKKKKRKKKREETMRKRTNEVPARPPPTNKNDSPEPISLPSSSKPIKISLTSTTKYTQKQLQRNSMRTTPPKSVDYKLLSERRKSGGILRAFKPIIFTQCEEDDEEVNDMHDEDLETEARLKEKLKWKADGEEQEVSSISRGFTAMSLKEIQESQSRNPLPSFRSMLGSQTKKEFSMEMFETRSVHREDVADSSCTSVTVSLSALARRTKSKKQIVDASPAPWLGSSGSFDKNKGFIGGSISSQQSPLRDLMRQEEEKQQERNASSTRPIYGFSPNAFSSTSPGSWFPSNDAEQGKKLTLLEIQAQEEKEKEERELVALVAAFEKAEKDGHKNNSGTTKKKKNKAKTAGAAAATTMTTTKKIPSENARAAPEKVTSETQQMPRKQTEKTKTTTTKKKKKNSDKKTITPSRLPTPRANETSNTIV